MSRRLNDFIKLLDPATGSSRNTVPLTGSSFSRRLPPYGLVEGN